MIISLQKAAEILSNGGLVAVPTETVYGLAARCDEDQAIDEIYKLKKRPGHNPLILHCENLTQIEQFADVHALERKLFKLYSPGPLTLVLKLKEGSSISHKVTAGLPTVAVRIPSHPLMQKLINRVGVPLAAPSANLSEQISPTNPEHVRSAFENLPILDGGPCLKGLESTILKVVGEKIYLLRPGSITPERLFEDLNLDVLYIEPGDEITEIETPGQMKRHYAPNKPLRLNVMSPRIDEALLSFGPRENKPFKNEKNLSLTGDLSEAARNLYAFLRELDESDAKAIAVMPIPNDGVGHAINDRLRRAAATKEG